MNKWVLDKFRSGLMMRKCMSERKMRVFGYIVRKNSMEKRLIYGEDGRQAEKGQTRKDDLKEWTKLDMAAASQMGIDRERWGEIIKVTAAQIAPPDWR